MHRKSVQDKEVNLMICSYIAENAKKIIKEKGYKQKAIAEKAGYDIQKFNNMLNGRKIIIADDILPIANALGVEPNELFQRDG